MEMVGAFSGLEEDLAALETEVKNAFRASRKALADDMRSCLEDHIEADVYDEFQPQKYVRRRDSGGLSDMQANTTVYSDEGLGGMELTLLYQPDGSRDGEGSEIENAVSGDDLVSRIEKKDPEYNWRRKPKKRPFFRNFVEEMIEGRRVEDTLVAAMNAADPALGLAADGDVTRESDDWR